MVKCWRGCNSMCSWSGVCAGVLMCIVIVWGGGGVGSWLQHVVPCAGGSTGLSMFMK